MIQANFEAVVPTLVVAEFEAVVPREKALPVKNKDILITTNGKYTVDADVDTVMTNVGVIVDNNTHYKELIDYGLPQDIAYQKDSEVKEMLHNTKTMGENLTLSEIKALKKDVLAFGDLSEVATGLFQGCFNLLAVGNITSTTNAISQLFYNCINLLSVGNINCPNVTSSSTAFGQCFSLQRVGIIDYTSVTKSPSQPFVNCSSLIDVGGVKGLKVTISFASSSLLSAKSVKNLMEMADAVSTATTLTLHATAKSSFLEACENNAEYLLVYDDFINNKGWTLA